VLPLGLAKVYWTKVSINAEVLERIQSLGISRTALELCPEVKAESRLVLI
jgi:hypothetical protein